MKKTIEQNEKLQQTLLSDWVTSIKSHFQNGKLMVKITDDMGRERISELLPSGVYVNPSEPSLVF